jgi:hypothetical protein
LVSGRQLPHKAKPRRNVRLFFISNFAPMQVAVWDTYVKKKNGNVLHFDIIVPESVKDAGTIYRYGKEYLKSKNEAEGSIDTEECQYCHVEDPTEEVKAAINARGYYILEMEEIPLQLPENPTRKDIILHLRAHHVQHRFADFKGKSLEDVKAILATT